MKITIPELSLVVLIGASGSGKSTFARKHFRPTEVLSSDYFRALIGDSEANQEVTQDAFDTLHFVAAKRLAGKRLTVIDATNVQPDARRPLLALARQYHYLVSAIVFDLPADVCQARNQQRPERNFGPHVVRGHVRLLRQSLRTLQREGFKAVHVLSSVEEVEQAIVERVPLWTDRRGEHGPFDIIGDVHGCFDELIALMQQLGYTADVDGILHHPEGRKALFVGDLVDRGPRTPDVLRLVMRMVEAGRAMCVVGNHDQKLCRALHGGGVKVTHGLQASLDQLAGESEEFRKRTQTFLDRLLSHYVLDDGRLVVAHAGLRENLQGRASGEVRSFALYGETTGERDDYGLPVRLDWAAEYRGKSMVVYGHTPVAEPSWVNNTINIDTGCVFGGRLTALRYPERELLSVPAAQTYCEHPRPLVPATPAPVDDLLDLDDVLGKRIVETRLQGRLTVREEQARAALEVMSRFALDPRWLVYLPPTMSPTETSKRPGLLEHPAEAFTYFADRGVAQVVCQEKHMGSRAVVVICRDAETASKRFGIDDPLGGACYTRTGRRFFDGAGVEAELFGIVRAALDRAGLWERFRSDWFVFDCELMPWSAKAQALLRQQYAAVGCASRIALAEAVTALGQLDGQPGAAELRTRLSEKATTAEAFTAAYRRYCWPVTSVGDLKLAPFHLLASEGAVHVNRDHVWHMEQLAELCAAAPGVLTATPCKLIDLSNDTSREEGMRWWEELTDRGGEGMVVKPIDFVPASHGRDRVQPALKCRGREYLRIIYGPDYTMPEHLERLRERGLGHKRSLASREFALGVEALERFVRREPLRRVHECVFALLALESDPIDPRL
jgi:protein phosphatase